MKKRSCPRFAFINPRALIGFVLLFVGVLLALFAFGAAPHVSQKFAAVPAPKGGGAGVPLSKTPGEPLPPNLEDQVPANYTGPHHDVRPVKAVHTRPLRQLPMIPPALAIRREVHEPARPKPPTDTPTGGVTQTFAGPVLSAPTSTGVSWDGVGVGLAGFVPNFNPPDTNGRVGATQYVQWNNASFAVFNKTTGALLYGPAAGNTLFQSLGGLCASHNDGDPVVSYDILAGRWVLSQFVVGGGQTDFSHQCFAVSATSDATGEYYLYDFQTDPVNFVDYPHTGVWPDGYYMSTHVFNPGGTFTAGRIYVFERAKMIAGLPARMQSQDLGAEYGFLPADLDSLTPPPVGEAEFILGPNFTLTELTDSFRVAVTWDTTPTLVVTPGPTIMGGIGNAPCVSGVNNPARDCVPEPG